MSTLEERFAEEVKRLGGPTEVAVRLGVARNTVYNWEKKATATLADLERLERLGMDVDYVLRAARARPAESPLSDVDFEGDEQWVMEVLDRTLAARRVASYAEAVVRPASVVHRWIKTGKIPRTALSKLCRDFGLDLRYLLTGEVTRYSAPGSNGPLIGNDAAAEAPGLRPPVLAGPDKTWRGILESLLNATLKGHPLLTGAVVTAMVDKVYARVQAGGAITQDELDTLWEGLTRGKP